MGKRAVVKSIATGSTINRRGRLYSPGAKEVLSEEAQEQEVAPEAVVEEVEDAPDVAPEPKPKRSYSRKKRSSKSSK